MSDTSLISLKPSHPFGLRRLVFTGDVHSPGELATRDREALLFDQNRSPHVFGNVEPSLKYYKIPGQGSLEGGLPQLAPTWGDFIDIL